MQAAAQGPPPSATAARIDGPDAAVVLDGDLSEPVWQRATVLDKFWQYQPVDGRPAEERTEVRVFYAPDAIYFGIHAFDTQPDGVRATEADRDNLDSEDRVSIYLDTFNDRRRAYFFTVNAFGSQQDGVRSEGAAAPGSFGATDDKNPDFIWQSKGRRTADGYVVEIRIPFKSLRYSAGESLTWGFNVFRSVMRTNYVDTWADTRRANASSIAQFGTLTGLTGIRRGVVTEVQPVLTARWDGARDSTGAFNRGNIKADPGLNVRFGFTSLTADVTVNPDFSQVESDAGLVTINERFALFFPERRPFFLEGIELFSTPNTLIYTRRIGDPKAGAKLTGKVGKTTIAYISAVDQTDAGDRLVNVTRLRRDLGANSTLGLAVTDRRGDGEHNTVAAADARIVFAKLYFAEAQVGHAWTGTPGTSERRGALWQFMVDRTGRLFGFNYRVTGIGNDFDAQNGFVPRTGYAETAINNRLSFYGGRGALVEQITMFGTLDWIWNYSDFAKREAIEGKQSFDYSMRLRGNWRAGAHLDRTFFTFDPANYAGYTVAGTGAPYDPPARLSGSLLPSVSAGSPTYRWGELSANVRYGELPIFPEAAAGRELRVSGTVLLRPTTTVRVSGTATYARLMRKRDGGGEFARTMLPRLKIEYQPTRALFFRVVGEYLMQRQAALQDARTGAPILLDGVPSAPTETNQLRLDWLASYEPTPGTVAFLGYGASLQGERAFQFRGLERSNDGFFMKVAYLMRW